MPRARSTGRRGRRSTPSIPVPAKPAARRPPMGPTIPPRSPRRRSVHFEDGEKRFLGDLDAPHLLHALLAFLLLLEKLALAADVAAVTLGGDVLAHRAHSLAGDDAGAERGLDGDLVLLAG